ncbi:MAG: Do family serine endopeptidase [Saprospiraceae bacterium]
MKQVAIIVLAALIGGFTALGTARYFNLFTTAAHVRSEVPAAVQFTNATAAATSAAPVEGFTLAAERAVPAVVHIKAAKRAERGMSGLNLRDLPPMFREFFGPEGFRGQGDGEDGEAPLQEGSGSGVIISSDGYIVTNNHVIEGAENLEVVLNDQRTYPATLVGTDPSTDVALIKIDAADLATIQFGNSDEVRVGEWVVAVGNPFSLTSTVTAGIVSAKGRSIDILRRKSDAAIESFIQTDAVVNPGNSGGALVNTEGRLVGINTAISSPTGVYAGYAFAVPSKIVAKVVADLKEYGVAQRAYLGARIQEINSAFARENDIDRDNGVYIGEVTANSAAEAAGLKKGDIVLAVDGVPTLRSSDLLEQLGRKRPGDRVELTILRDKREQMVPVVLRNRSGNEDIVTAAVASNDVLAALGGEFKELSREEANRMNLRGGVVIDRVNEGFLKDQTEIEPGFIVTHVDRQPVASVEDFEKMVKRHRGDGVLLQGRYPDSSRNYYYGIGLD